MISSIKRARCTTLQSGLRYCGFLQAGRCVHAAPDRRKEEGRMPKKTRRPRNVRAWLAVVAASLACITAALYALAALIQLVLASLAR